MDLLTTNCKGLKILSEAKKSDDFVLITVSGPILQFGSINQNGRKYSEAIADKIMNNPLIKSQIERNGLFGEAKHPQGRSEVWYSEISHSVKKLWKEGKTLYAELDILDTPNGRVIADLIQKYGHKVSASLRALGTVKNKGNYDEVDVDTYEFITIDLVTDPSEKTAIFTPVFESLQHSIYNLLNTADKGQIDYMKPIFESHNIAIDNLDLNTTRSVIVSLNEQVKSLTENEVKLNIDKEFLNEQNSKLSEENDKLLKKIKRLEEENSSLENALTESESKYNKLRHKNEIVESLYSQTAAKVTSQAEKSMKGSSTPSVRKRVNPSSTRNIVEHRNNTSVNPVKYTKGIVEKETHILENNSRTVPSRIISKTDSNSIRRPTSVTIVEGRNSDEPLPTGRDSLYKKMFNTN